MSNQKRYLTFSKISSIQASNLGTVSISNSLNFATSLSNFCGVSLLRIARTFRSRIFIGSSGSSLPFPAKVQNRKLN